MKRTYVILTAILLVLIFNVSDSFAQLPGIAFGARVGRNWKTKDQYAGGQVELGISSFTLAPNVEYYLSPKNGLKKRLDINLDGQYTLFSLVVAKIFVGAGYVISNEKADLAGAKSTSVKGFDVQGGAKMNLLFLHPFGLIKFEKLKGESKGSILLSIGANMGF